MNRPFVPRAWELVAILAGRQTLLLRPIKPQPPADGRAKPFVYGAQSNKSYALGWRTDEDLCGVAVCPFGKAGDSLWIKEKHWIDWYPNGVEVQGQPGCVHYRMGHPYPGIALDLDRKKLWRSAITMPRWASRHTLRVLDVRALQIHNITNADAFATGVEPVWTRDAAGIINTRNERGMYPVVALPEIPNSETPGEWRHKSAFRVRWDTVYGEQGWGINPWAWAVRVEVVR